MPEGFEYIGFTIYGESKRMLRASSTSETLTQRSALRDVHV